MGKVSKNRRRFAIKKKKKRKQKIKNLREKYFVTKNGTEKEKIREKFKKLAPYLSSKEILRKN